MLQWFPLFLLAFAVSLDSFGVGLTYGLRKIRIPLRSIFIIACCSAAMIFLATGVAHSIMWFMSPRLAEGLGGFILIALGTWALYQCSATKVKKRSRTLDLKRFGLVTQILRKPATADMDRSGIISATEALILGVALSLDAFGAGMGAALMGYPPWLSAVLMGTMSSLFVYLGMKFGSMFSSARWINQFSYWPGIILITFGLCKTYMIWL